MMGNISIDEGHRESPARCVDQAATGDSTHQSPHHFNPDVVSSVSVSDSIGTVASAASGVDRSELDDQRVIYHEMSHATVGRLVTGAAIGGVTCEPGLDYSGLCWGPKYDRSSRFAGPDDAPSFCEKIGQLMPKPGESRSECANIYLHCFHRVTELVSGTEGERLFMPGEPWFAADDERQAIAYASLITSSPASAAAFIEACRVESRALLTASMFVVHALAKELQIARTMDGAAVDRCIECAVAAKALADERVRRAKWAEIFTNARNFPLEKLMPA